MIILNQEPLANDTVSFKPIAKWTKEYTTDNSDKAFWYPFLFGGMPSVGSHINTPGNPINSIINIFMFNRGLKYWLYFTLGGFGLYIIIINRSANTLSAVFGGLAYAISPYLFGLINAGHSSKIIALGYAPWVFLAADYCIRKNQWRGVLFLALTTAIQLWSNHPQIVYYTWMLIVFWWLWNLVGDMIKRKQTMSTTLKPTSLLIGSIIIALLMVSDPYISVYEFQQHSNRGATSVLDESGQTDTGTSWDYATQWSFQPKELISFLYPYYYGLQNYPSRDIKSAAYWGGMPFTQSTHYMGLLVVLTAVLGALLKRPDRFQAYLWVTTGLILLVGFGKYVPVLYGPLFKLAPFFSKFRVPSMIYALLPFTLSILAAVGLENIMAPIKGGSEVDRKIVKKVLWVFGSFIGLTLVYLLFGNSIVSFLKPTETSQYNPQVIDQLKIVRQELFQKGIFLALAISVAGFAAIWMGIKQKVKPQFVGIAIIALTVVDLWVVDNEFLHLKNSSQMDLQFQPNAITDYLTADKDLFRIFPVDELNSNWYGYFGLASIGGYRPVKLRTYQDLMDAGGLNNLAVLNMLNVKYLITGKSISHPALRLALAGQPSVYKNTAVLPKAWIVGKIRPVASQKESLAAVLDKNFSPAAEAIVMDYSGPVLDSAVTGAVTVEKYTENEIILKADVSATALLVLSENYYKPGWLVSVNGIKTTIYQTNHVLRSVVVPQGKHTLRFWYNDRKWKTTRLISRISLALTLLAVGYVYRLQIVGLIKRKS
ncbi:MAG: hypothetical protein ABIA75_07525 [Candidatus Neomarinimicrobiota bacterium]